MSTLVIFARAPLVGAVKTRLGRVVGDAAALALYEAFLDDVCQATAGLGARRVLAVAGDLEHPHLGLLAKSHRMELVAQGEGDLGTRLSRALGSFGDGGPVCILGSDAPTLPREHLHLGLDALLEHEVAIGPASDGGSWLIGGHHAEPDLLRELPWSTPALLPTLLGRLAGRSAALLPFWYDVDDGDDLTLLRAHLGLLPPSVAPATRRVLAGLAATA